jgi:hypothetical protein
VTSIRAAGFTVGRDALALTQMGSITAFDVRIIGQKNAGCLDSCLLFAFAHALYAPVVVMEEQSVRAALRRARDLARRTPTTVLIISALQFALPVLVLFASFDVDLTFKLDEHWQPKEFGFGFATSGTLVWYQLLNIVVTPLTGTMTALLYLKTCHAGGESMRDAAERLAGVDVPRSRWQRVS